PTAVDVRVIAATNKNLESEIHENHFREDLYYRLNVVPMTVPPLRERREDIPLLVAHFTALLSRQQGMAPRTFTQDAIERLATYDWPGNVRELRNTVERAFLLAKLREHDWNVSETARLLDMPRSNLYKKIERYGLTREHA